MIVLLFEIYGYKVIMLKYQAGVLKWVRGLEFNPNPLFPKRNLISKDPTSSTLRKLSRLWSDLTVILAQVGSIWYPSMRCKKYRNHKKSGRRVLQRRKRRA